MRITEADHEAVTRAVAEAELTTSGEIVTVVARTSDGYTDVALSIAAFLAFTKLVALAFFPDLTLGIIDSLTGGWNTEWTPAGLFGLASGIGIATFLIVYALLLIPAVRFALIPGRVKTLRVEDAAIRHFKVGAERRTHGRTGVLIYVSLQEHRAQIVADEAIAAKVDPEVWGAAMVDMLREIKAGDLGAGIAAGVRDVGVVLSEHFPRADDDQNELPDRLIAL
ncbi:TPM domain-containing protein [Alteriqipengyuania sp.]|uniref:TPM domain-containing protein n=1 Tax=Alteriqipengyuania sp. TaxID=2800692 RepID=UPI0035158C56